MVLKSTLAALAVLTVAVSSASALPASVHGKATVQTSSITEVQYRRQHVRPAPRVRPGPRYVPGRRYAQAPRGWHRYHARPGNWRTRGCVLVGPLWFCP